MNYREMKEAIKSAELTLRMADMATTDMADLLVGRLRKVQKTYRGVETLKALKKELKQFDSKRGVWKN